MPPADELVPELYQLVGAALRDVAQARFMSDVFSRQISFVYEGDGVLRRFPVPRVDIEEAEITLHFAIKEVAVDPARHSSRNAAIGALFDKYSLRIVREAMKKARDALRVAVGAVNDPNAAAVLAEFEKRHLSDEARELIAGRLLQKFNESADSLCDGSGNTEDELTDLVKKFIARDPTVSMLTEEIKGLRARYPDADWTRLDSTGITPEQQVKDLTEAINSQCDRYPDYKLLIDANAAALATPGLPVSSIKIRSTVRNYKWSKVEVDPADMRNIRTLSPE